MSRSPSARKSAKTSPRRQFFVDPKVQGTLLARGASYWLLTCLTVFLGLLVWQTVNGPARIFYKQLDAIWFRYAPVFVLLALLLPIFAYDVLRVSNRFVGPMVRMRRAMKKLARGEQVAPVVFRDNDFWQDFATDFNEFIATMQAHKSTDAAPTPRAETKPDRPTRDLQPTTGPSA